MKFLKSFSILFFSIFCSIVFIQAENTTKKLTSNGIEYSIQMSNQKENIQSLKDFERIRLGRSDEDVEKLLEFYKQFTPCLIQISNETEKEYNYESDSILGGFDNYGHQAALNWQTGTQTFLHLTVFSINTTLGFTTNIFMASLIAKRFFDYQTNLYPFDLLLSFYGSIGLVIAGSTLQLIRFFVANPTVFNQYSEALINNGLFIQTNQLSDETNIVQTGQRCTDNTIPSGSSLFVLRFIDNDKIDDFQKWLNTVSNDDE